MSIHHSDEVSQARGCRWAETAAELRGGGHEVGDDIGQRLGVHVREAGLDA
ncbi:MAG TPA: hypothetical protein VI072_14300 [Polyangiaceae bacterium]